MRQGTEWRDVPFLPFGHTLISEEVQADVEKLKRFINAYGALVLYAALVIIQLVAAGVAANETSGSTETVIIATLVVTSAATPPGAHPRDPQSAVRSRRVAGRWPSPANSSTCSPTGSLS